MAISALISRFTGLLDGDWSPGLGAGRHAPTVSRGERGLRLSYLRRADKVPPGPPVETLLCCSFDGARIEGGELTGSCAMSSFTGATLTQALAAEGSSAQACRLDGATLTQPALRHLEASACSLREAHVQGGELPQMTVCDLVGARLEGTRLRRAVACDLSLATLIACDLRDADLQGSSFRRASLQGVRLEGARVTDADFTGARGLDGPTRAALIEGGARLRGAAWMGMSRRLWPLAAPLDQHKRAVALEWLGNTLLLFGVLGACALALNPPPAPQAPAPPPALSRAPSAEERLQAQASLKQLREALQRAHDMRVARGAQQAVWPTLVELQDNRFDVDGDGPREVQEALVSGGLPDNPLTETRGGAVVYCEEQTDQAAISGVDTDWFYCEHTGRVFAAAGRSGEATLNW